MKGKDKTGKKPTIVDKAFAVWLKYDPLVSLVVGNRDELRRDVMLNILGPEAAQKHYGRFPPRRPSEGPILPDVVRKLTESSLNDPQRRTTMIKTLIHWSTDPAVNNRYIDSHLTRVQVVMSLLGPVFFRVTQKQEDILMKGLKYMLAKKMTVVGEEGEQATDVHDALLARTIEILVYNQKVIIKKAVSEAEEKMHANLLRQIQKMRGDKGSSHFSGPEMKTKVRKIVKEKFPLRKETMRHFEDILNFYVEQEKWPHLSERAAVAKQRLLELRIPLTLTSPERAR